MDHVPRAGSPRIWLLVLCTLILPTSLRAEDEAELLTLVKAGHRSAQESIHSLSCAVRRERVFPNPGLSEEGKYWRSFGVFRIQQAGSNLSPAGTADYYLLGHSEVRHVFRNPREGGRTEWGAGRRPGQSSHPLDVWREMFLWFDVYLSIAKTAPRAKREKIDGRNCVRLTMTCDMSGEEGHITYWFDVDRNYLAWKKATDVKGDRYELEMVEVLEPQPGVFFPIKRVSKHFRGSQQVSQGAYTLSDVRINEPIARSVFELPRVPSGTMCNDLIRKQRYPIDETWQQIPGSRADPFDIHRITGSPGPQPFTAQSTEEPRSWTGWLAPVSLAVLVVAGALWVYRRYRVRPLET